MQPGDAVRIMTGAPLPAGADAVVPAEYVRETRDGIETSMAFGRGKHVGRVGEDIARGATVLAAGRRLRPQDAGVLRRVKPTPQHAQPSATAPRENMRDAFRANPGALGR